MSRARIRSLLAATAIAAVMAYGLVGHGASETAMHDDMAGAAAVCLLLVTLLGNVALPRTGARRPRAVPVPQLLGLGVLPGPPDARARASPSVLQRFRN